MKTGKSTARLLTILLMTVGFASFAENRLADQSKRSEHCAPLPADKCSPSLDRHYSRGCITQEEYNYGKSVSPQRVPLCVEVEDSQWLFHKWCYCSCFAKGTRIWVEDITTSTRQWLAIEDAVGELDRYHLVVPASNASMSGMVYETREILTWTSGPESSPLIVLKTAGGKELAVTANHQVLLSDGQLVEASHIRVGDGLVELDGSIKEVTGIELRIAEEDVYNVLTSGSNLIFAEGFLVGDLLWENSPEEKVRAFVFPRKC